MEIEYKQFVIVPKKPHMSRGKVASQVAHATFMALEKQREIVHNKIKDSVKAASLPFIKYNNIDDWKETGMCVIVLECDDEVKLHGIAEYCKQWDIPYHIYIDEGITEIPMGTATAFATGVLPSDKHWMFEQLKLFTDRIPVVKKKRSWL